MTNTTVAKSGISASTLRILALLLMLLDHLWATVIPGNNWMTYAGRLAFPIFAFQLSEGFLRTSDRRRYAKRLFLFALVSEIPFNLMYISSPVFPFHQNVMFTLLLGFMAMSGLERIQEKRSVLKGILMVSGACLLSVVGFVDYGWRGVATIIMFYLLRDIPFARLGQLVCMVLLNIVWFKGESLLLTLAGQEYFLPTQGFAVLALLPIWLYHGNQGLRSKGFQYTSYLFYPLHMLLLYLLRTFFF